MTILGVASVEFFSLMEVKIRDDNDKTIDVRRKTRDVYQGVGAQHLEPSGIQKVGAQHLEPSGIPKGIPLWYFVGCWRELQQQQIVLTPFTPFRGLGGKRGLEEKYIPPRSNLS